MIKIIAGEKGKGKTKYLIEQANKYAQSSNGTVVYLDKSSRRMYELDNKIRLINVCDYPVVGENGLISFICGLASGNYDIEYVFIDSFLTISDTKAELLEKPILELNKISTMLNITFVISVSCDEYKIPEKAKNFIEISL